jgi:tetratricopeptide (TPR) repeat protein
MRIAKDCNQDDNLATADSMETLASLLMASCTARVTSITNEENDMAALRLLRDAIQVRKKLNGENTLPYAKSLHCLGVLLLRKRARKPDVANKKDIDEAVHCLYQSLRIQEMILDEHLDVAATLHLVGLALKEKAGISQQRRMVLFDEALKHMARSLRIRRSVLEAVDPTSPSPSLVEHGFPKQEAKKLFDLLMGVMENLYDVAMLHGIRREWERAKELLKEALSTLDSATDVFLGQLNHPDRPVLLIPQEFKAWKANIWHRVAVIEAASGNCQEAINGKESVLLTIPPEDFAKIQFSL